MLFWIIYPLAVIVVWEYFGMGLIWHGLYFSELTAWGREDIFNMRWAYRVGPLEIYRM